VNEVLSGSQSFFKNAEIGATHNERFIKKQSV